MFNLISILPGDYAMRETLRLDAGQTFHRPTTASAKDGQAGVRAIGYSWVLIRWMLLQT